MLRNFLLFFGSVTLSSSIFAWSLFGTDFDAAAYGEVVFGVDAPYPPYAEFDSNGNLTGFEVELGNKACEYLQIQCRWVISSWDDIIPNLNNDQFDIIMSSMSITSEREKLVDFGDAYYAMPSVFFARKSDQINGSSSRQMANHTIAVQRGTVQHDYLLKKYSGSRIVAMDDWDQVEDAFRKGVADVIFADYQQYEKIFFLEGGYEIIGDVVRVDRGIGLAFRQNDDALREAMNQVFDELKKNGEYERIRRKYFFFDIMVK